MKVVMFVFNDCRTDTRVLREAATLTGAGHHVTIMARPTDLTSTEGDREERDGFEIIRVPVPDAWRARWIRFRDPWRLRPWVVTLTKGVRRDFPRGLGAAMWAWLVVLVASPWIAIRLVGRRLPQDDVRPPGGSTIDWLIRWRFGVRGWAQRASAAAPIGDVYHGHDLNGLPAAVAAASRNGGTVVYDSHELFLEAGSNARRPRWSKWILGTYERRLASRARALITVNRTLEGLLRARLGVSRTVVVHNCPPRWTPPEPRPDLIRGLTGIAPDVQIVLYHGGFTADRGLVELAAAMREPGLEAAALVFLGFGPLESTLRELACEAPLAGRVHVLDAVPPEQLADWVASAGLGAMPNQPRTENERISTPNKLFETLAVGLPVVSSDFPERHRIIADDPDGPLGALCDPTRPASIAAAIRSIVDLPPESRDDLRRRCLKAAHERWNWETEGAKLIALYAELARAP